MGGKTGSPSTRTTWQPTPSEGVASAISMLRRWPERGPSAWRWSARRPMQLRDGAVDTARQPEVVRVDDEAAHRVSLSTLRGVHPNSGVGKEELRDPRWYDDRRPQLPLRLCGRLAQLVRAPALQAGCRGFESLTAHQ
jgi:hypothetical protein